MAARQPGRDRVGPSERPPLPRPRIRGYAWAGRCRRSAVRYRLAVASPIVVEGRLWGAMMIASPRREPLPEETEARLTDFAELVAMAIANAESRAAADRLADEQSALRRVAELVARQASPEQVFGLVTEELSRLLDVTTVGRGGSTRRDRDDLAVRGTPRTHSPGTNFEIRRGSAIGRVFRTGHPALENDARSRARLALHAQAGHGVAAAGPIVVDGRLWGAIGRVRTPRHCRLEAKSASRSSPSSYRQRSRTSNRERRWSDSQPSRRRSVAWPSSSLGSSGGAGIRACHAGAQPPAGGDHGGHRPV